MKRPLVAFFLLTFAIAWGAACFALALQAVGYLTMPFRRLDPAATAILFMALWAPGLSGFILMYRNDGWMGVYALASRLSPRRAPWRWWAAAVLLPLGLQILALLVAGQLSEVSFARFGPENWTSAAYVFVFGFLFSPLGEEIGWRGFALPRLTKHMSALSAALLTGVIWIVWHAPVFLVPPLERAIFPPGLSYLAFACMALPVSVLISWVYLNGRSLLLPVFFHFLVLFQVTSIQKDAPLALVWASISLFAAAAALVVVSYGPELVRQTESATQPAEA